MEPKEKIGADSFHRKSKGKSDPLRELAAEFARKVLGGTVILGMDNQTQWLQMKETLRRLPDFPRDLNAAWSGVKEPTGEMWRDVQFMGGPEGWRCLVDCELQHEGWCSHPAEALCRALIAAKDGE